MAAGESKYSRWTSNTGSCLARRNEGIANILQTSKYFLTKTHLQTVEVTHSSDPVHQQGNLSAAVFICHPGLRGTWLKAPIGPQRRQPPLGHQGSLQEANFIPQLILLQNHLHLNRLFDSSISINSFHGLEKKKKKKMTRTFWTTNYKQGRIHTWNAKMIFHKRLSVFSLCPSTTSLESMVEPENKDTMLKYLWTTSANLLSKNGRHALGRLSSKCEDFLLFSVSLHCKLCHYTANWISLGLTLWSVKITMIWRYHLGRWVIVMAIYHHF